MKTLTLLLFIFSMTSLSFSQSQLKDSESANTIYLNQVSAKDSPVKVKKLQKLAALYDISKSSDFNPTVETSYNIIFEETSCKIVATYDKDGEIIGTVEEYKDLKLPIKLLKKIVKKYPNCQLVGNVFRISYNINSKAEKLYSVKIKNGSETKNLQFVLSDLENMSYVATN